MNSSYIASFYSNPLHQLLLFTLHYYFIASFIPSYYCCFLFQPPPLSLSLSQPFLISRFLGDQVYMDDKDLLHEYILNDHGHIFQGSGSSSVYQKPWNYGQVSRNISLPSPTHQTGEE